MILTDNGIVGEGRKCGGRGKFSFLQASYQYGLRMQECREFAVAVQNAIAVKLKYCIGEGRRRIGL